MNKSKLTAKNLPRLIPLLFVLLAALCISFVSFYFLPTISGGATSSDVAPKEQNYHILVVGRSENESFLQQVYNGAQRQSKPNRAVVELYVPRSRAEDVSLQMLFDYASFVNADGVIAYIDQTDTNLTPPSRLDGMPIPLITVGHYIPELPQVSFIGNNYSELGRKIGDETIAYLDGKGTVLLLSGNNDNSPYYSSAMSSLLTTLNSSAGIVYRLFDQAAGENLPLFNDKLAKEIYAINGPAVLICLSAEDTIRAAQVVAELDQSRPAGLIGFGDNETLQLYFNKGIVSELLSVNPEKIGETAIRELFEYRNHGYANSYITADVQVRKSKNVKN